jgi:hypothetical protein
MTDFQDKRSLYTVEKTSSTSKLEFHIFSFFFKFVSYRYACLDPNAIQIRETLPTTILKILFEAVQLHRMLFRNNQNFL